MAAAQVGQELKKACIGVDGQKSDITVREACGCEFYMDVEMNCFPFSAVIVPCKKFKVDFFLHVIKFISRCDSSHKTLD